VQPFTSLYPAALLAYADNVFGMLFGFNITHTYETDWFFSNPSGKTLTEKANNYFYRKIQAAKPSLCNGGSIGQMSFFGRDPRHQAATLENEATFEQSYYSGLFVVGDVEYNFDDFLTRRYGDTIVWSATVRIIDKMGWDVTLNYSGHDGLWEQFLSELLGKDYTLALGLQVYAPTVAMPANPTPPRLTVAELAQALDQYTAFLFGPDREFVRGQYLVSGSFCCKE
jgi:hypothetical protein